MAFQPKAQGIVIMNPQKENPFYSLLFNIILPVIILNKGDILFASGAQAPIWILLTALSLPLVYGLKDFIQAKKINFISLLGLVSVGLTGGLALLRLEGIYFAIKEAAVPLALAGGAGLSVLIKKPLARLIVFKSSLFDTQRIQEKLQENKTEKRFESLMNISTWVLAGSFILSAVLNFIIAIFVFKSIDPLMEEDIKRQTLNEQVADMTWMGYVFIALPLTLITGFLLWWILKRLKFLTGLSLEELVPQIKK